MAQAEIPIHADFDRAPGVLEAPDFELAPEDCGLDFWIPSVAQGVLMGLDRGKRPESSVPDFLREPGDPLRDNLISEFAFRSLSEWEATRLCGLITASAPNIPTMEFYSTQALDEARHSQTFRYHLVDLGVPEDELHETIGRVAGPDAERIFPPIWDWGLPKIDQDDAFIDCVVLVTILLEGVLAPTTELSERKWKPISQATADIERGACVDEIRHLAVGSWIIREYVEQHPEERAHLVEFIADGRRMWSELPTLEMVVKREEQFQKGLELHRDEIGTDYEIFPGRPLVDTTVEERLTATLKWSLEVQDTRLRYMGLEEAIPEVPEL